MAEVLTWSRAFALQAEADWISWNILREFDLPESQSLHFLQMACEKLVKAHLFGPGQQDPIALQTTHAVIRKYLKTIVIWAIKRLAPTTPSDRRAALARTANQIAGEIEWLHPACDDEGRCPANVEYPWAENNILLVPAQHRFPMTTLLKQPHVRDVLKLIGESIRLLAANSTT